MSLHKSLVDQIGIAFLPGYWHDCEMHMSGKFIHQGANSDLTNSHTHGLCAFCINPRAFVGNMFNGTQCLIGPKQPLGSDMHRVQAFDHRWVCTNVLFSPINSFQKGQHLEPCLFISIFAFDC